MASILFFSIPAHGHVNPTLPLVRELVARGHDVSYYNAETFRAKIESTGVSFVPIDAFMPPAPDDLSSRVGKDFAALIEMAADTTLALESDFAKVIKNKPVDLIIADSVCLWGKLLAQKYGIPMICSTTTFAFNSHTASRMKQRPIEILRMLFGMPRIGKKLALLRSHGFDASNLPALIGNVNTTPTIVYTSRLFQPESETFADNYAFIGPLVMERYPRIAHERPKVYVSLGTVLHDAPEFYRTCIKALDGIDCDAVISVGESVDSSRLGEIPANVRIFPRVNQLEVLAGADVFLTHCGMNSASESLLCGVPMVLHPLHSEEEAVAGRVEELGAGLRLKRVSEKGIRKTIETVLGNPIYREAAQRISEDFSKCGGAQAGAEFIESIISKQQKRD